MPLSRRFTLADIAVYIPSQKPHFKFKKNNNSKRDILIIYKNNVSIFHLGLGVDCFRDFLKLEESKISIPEYTFALIHFLLSPFEATLCIHCQYKIFFLMNISLGSWDKNNVFLFSSTSDIQYHFKFDLILLLYVKLNTVLKPANYKKSAG